MKNSFTLIKGSKPLLISMPHNGQAIPTNIANNMNDEALEIRDTDWYLDQLYDFAQSLGAYILIPRYNRYVIDLNRDPKGVNLYPGANSTELCPTTAFNLTPLYRKGCLPTEAEISRRIELYWQPYHQELTKTLADIKTQFGRAILLEAHSILSHVPRFFEGQLPDFNFGTADGHSCSQLLLKQIEAIDFEPYSQVSNGRFKGGYITRHFGQPDQNIDAIQLELSQITYMNEDSRRYSTEKAQQVKPKLKQLVTILINYGLQEK